MNTGNNMVKAWGWDRSWLEGVNGQEGTSVMLSAIKIYLKKEKCYFRNILDWEYQ